jgi:hypothetical protein
MNELDKIIAALPGSARPRSTGSDVDTLAALIREAHGDHTLGAHGLAEALIVAGVKPPTPRTDEQDPPVGSVVIEEPIEGSIVEDAEGDRWVRVEGEWWMDPKPSAWIGLGRFASEPLRSYAPLTLVRWGTAEVPR